jgi:hypothetical protein
VLQVELKTFASDALEDAMRLAQTKALNSYNWSDMLNYLNYSWSDVYNRVAMVDDGYYSTTVQLNTAMTTLPPFVKNSITVYAAQDPIGFNRQVFRASGQNDLRTNSVYHISGYDLYCPDAVRRTVWLNFVPMAPMLFFTKNNRDPKLIEEDPFPHNALTVLPGTATPEEMAIIAAARDYGTYTFVIEPGGYILRHKSGAAGHPNYPLSHSIDRLKEDLKVVFIQCDYPYIFVTYQHVYSKAYVSGFYRDIQHNIEFVQYNPFDFTGRESNVEYIKCKYNDKTGMGVVVRDWNDYDDRERRWRVKELGWTPDTILVYPCPEMYRYLVARLADKFASFNESDVMGVSKELVEAQYAFEAFCARDKSSFQRITNVNGPSIGDWL